MVAGVLLDIPIYQYHVVSVRVVPFILILHILAYVDIIISPIKIHNKISLGCSHGPLIFDSFSTLWNFVGRYVHFAFRPMEGTTTTTTTTTGCLFLLVFSRVIIRNNVGDARDPTLASTVVLEIGVISSDFFV